MSSLLSSGQNSGEARWRSSAHRGGKASLRLTVRTRSGSASKKRMRRPSNVTSTMFPQATITSKGAQEEPSCTGWLPNKWQAATLDMRTKTKPAFRPSI